MNRPSAQPRDRSALLAVVAASAAAALLVAWIATPCKSAAAVAPVVAERISIPREPQPLIGTLRRSAEGRELSGIVFLPAMEPALRASQSLLGDSLAAAGYAVLTYETEPVSGDTSRVVPDTTRFAEFARTAAAAAQALREQPAVRDDAVGLLGSGLATWVLPRAASVDTQLAFVIAVSGGPVGIGELELQRRRQALVDDGYGPANVERGKSVVWMYFEYLKSSGLQRVENVRDDYRRYRLEPWFPLLELPERDPTQAGVPPAGRRLAMALQYDPAPSFARLRVPLLALLGEADRELPLAAMIRAYERLGSPSVTVRVLEGADHGLGQPAGERAGRLSPDVTPAVHRWIPSVLPE